MTQTGTPLVEIVVTERLSGQASTRLQGLLVDALELRPAELVVDLADCEAIDAVALDVLLDIHRRVWHLGGRLTLRAPSPRLEHLLALARVDHVFHVTHGRPPQRPPTRLQSTGGPRRCGGAPVSAAAPDLASVPLVIVSDLLPGWSRAQPTIGIDGLPDDPATTALTAIIHRNGGMWVGRHPEHTEQPWSPQRTVRLDPTVLGGYRSHARHTIWPVYHSLVRPAEHDQTWRELFQRANDRFARAAATLAAPGGSVWVLDYHLQLVPGLLRRLRPDLRIGFYLTTTFPPGDLMRQVPTHHEILAGLLGAGRNRFPCATAAENLLQLRADTSAVDHAGSRFRAARETEVGVYPLSVDTASITDLTGMPTVAQRSAEIRSSLGRQATVLLSIDAPGDAAGVLARLRALRAMLTDRTVDPDDVAVIQVMTDGEQPGAGDTMGAIAREVARINGQFATIGHPCVHFTHNSPSLAERVALYQTADVFMATPLRAGASPWALEYVAAARPAGALVLSEFSGTAGVLPEAFLVNPYDRGEICRGLTAALAASPQERAQRLDVMRSYVESYDIHAWARLFHGALRGGRPAAAAVDHAAQLGARR